MNLLTQAKVQNLVYSSKEPPIAKQNTNSCFKYLYFCQVRT